MAYWRQDNDIVVVDDDGRYVDAEGWIWHRCRNLDLSGCTWLSTLEDGQCFSCDLTRTRPNDADARGLDNFWTAERAKRRLIIELDALGLPIMPRSQDPDHGLAFDLLSSAAEQVTTGHSQGVITIDLSESEPVHRERIRVDLSEAYRTMLGHFRHEIGHYYQFLLIADEELDSARAVFGDESVDYVDALDRHYRDGPPADWSVQYISQYASMHPYEDFAETFAHFMHISATITTAREFSLTTIDPQGFSEFHDLVRGVWIPLSIAFNQINQAMGKDDLYPFVIAPPVLDKLDFVAAVVKSTRAKAAA